MFSDMLSHEFEPLRGWTGGQAAPEQAVEFDIVPGGSVPPETAADPSEMIVASERRRPHAETTAPQSDAVEASDTPTAERPRTEAVRSVGAAANGHEVEMNFSDDEGNAAERDEAVPPSVEGGGGGGDKPPDDLRPEDANTPDDEGDEESGEDDESGETPRRPWGFGEVRPAIQKVVSLLNEHGVDPDEVLWHKPAQRALLPDILNDEVDWTELTETGMNVPRNAGKALNNLIDAAREAGVDPERLPQPHGSLRGERADPETRVVGAWLGRLHRDSNVSFEDLAEQTGHSESSIRRFLGAVTRPNSPQLARKIALELGADPETAAKLEAAHKAERRKDYDLARAILDEVTLPEPPVPAATAAAEAQDQDSGRAQSEDMPGSGESESEPADEPASSEAEGPAVERRWLPGQAREALRQLSAHGIDLVALAREHAPSKKTFQTATAMLPYLLSEQTNAEISDEFGTVPSQVIRITEKLIDFARPGVPEELQHLLQPGGGPKPREREPDPIGGVIQDRLRKAGLTQEEAAAQAGISLVTLGRLIRGERPTAHPALALQSTLNVLQRKGVLPPDAANELTRQYQERRVRLIRQIRGNKDR